jgi:hypothetical protein
MKNEKPKYHTGGYVKSGGLAQINHFGYISQGSVNIPDSVYAEMCARTPPVKMRIWHGKKVYDSEWSWIRNYLTRAFWESVFFMRGYKI